MLALDERGERIVWPTRSAGLSISQGNGRPTFHLSDPDPEDAEPLSRGVGPRPARPSRKVPESVLSVAAYEHVARTLVDRCSRLRPGLRVAVRVVGSEQRVAIGLPPEGRLVTDVRRGCRVRVELTADGRGPAVAESRLDDADGDSPFERLALDAFERFERGGDTRDLDPGDQEVVFAPSVGGVLLHEIVGHAVEADVFLAGTSWLAELEERVAPEQVTILDDPQRGRIAWRFDDEGEQARSTVLIRDGLLAGCVHDRATARRAATSPTGHGRRASFREPVRPRLGCTYLRSGSAAPQDAVRSVQRGVYIRRMESGSTDPRSGRALFRVTDADRIESGQRSYPVHAFLLLVNARSALAGLRCIADDLTFDNCIGSCHRDGQPLATSVGTPTMCIGLAKVLSLGKERGAL